MQGPLVRARAVGAGAVWGTGCAALAVTGHYGWSAAATVLLLGVLVGAVVHLAPRGRERRAIAPAAWSPYDRRRSGHRRPLLALVGRVRRQMPRRAGRRARAAAAGPAAVAGPGVALPPRGHEGKPGPGDGRAGDGRAGDGRQSTGFPSRG